MRRDMDAVREILLSVEAGRRSKMDVLGGAAIAALSPEDVEQHVRMLVLQAGFLNGLDASSSNRRYWIELELTWQGHEYLDTIRDPEIWRKTKAGAAGVGGLSLELMADLAKGLIRQRIKTLIGIDL